MEYVREDGMVGNDLPVALMSRRGLFFPYSRESRHQRMRYDWNVQVEELEGL